MRKAHKLSHDKGIKIVITLHDALYASMHREEEVAKQMDDFLDSMREAFVFYFPENREVAKNIRLDPFIWGVKDTKEIVTLKGEKIPCDDLYIDERAVKDYEFFKNHFEEALW